MHEGVKIYSTINNDKWKPLNYLFAIKSNLEIEDPTLTYREFQAVVWSLAGDMGIAPEFDVTKLDDSELPSRLLANGKPNFSRERVVSIVSRVRQEYNSTASTMVNSFGGFVLETNSDEQDVYTPPVDDSDPGTVVGRVVDALTSNPIAGATVEIDEFTTTTGSDGSFSFTDLLAPGTYSGTITQDRYASSTVSNIQVLEQQTTDLGTIGLSPNLSSGEIRIVLTWGQNPSDLDSHLTGPLSSTTRFHIAYFSRGSLTSSPFAQLDLDDATSFGPETMTISQRFDGTYRYSVHDYTNRFSSTSSGLANSGATVRVFDEVGQIAEFTVPDEPGTLWTVFTLDGSSGTITPQNTMSFVSSPTAVNKAIPTNNTDGSKISEAISAHPKN